MRDPLRPPDGIVNPMRLFSLCANLLATSLSRGTIRDASQLPHLFETYTGPLASLTGDRGYDQASVYREALGRNANASVVIHPRTNGIHSRRKLELQQRNEHLESIRSNGIYRWRTESGYYRQSTVENAFYRYKTVVGGRVVGEQQAESERREGQGGRGDSGLQTLESVPGDWTT